MNLFEQFAGMDLVPTIAVIMVALGVGALLLWRGLAYFFPDEARRRDIDQEYDDQRARLGRVVSLLVLIQRRLTAALVLLAVIAVVLLVQWLR